MGVRTGAAAPGGEATFVEIDPGRLSRVFAVPAWLRDLGLMSWLVVGTLLLLVGVVWLLSLTATIVIPVITATILAAVLSPVVGWLAGHPVGARRRRSARPPPRSCAGRARRRGLIAPGSAGTYAAITMAVIVLLANGVLKQMIQPIAYGAALGIHPLAVLIVTIAGGSLFETIGLILAAPVTSAIVKISSDLARATEAHADADADEPKRPPDSAQSASTPV